MRRLLPILASLILIVGGIFIIVLYMLSLKESEEIYAGAANEYTKVLMNQAPTIIMDDGIEADEEFMYASGSEEPVNPEGDDTSSDEDAKISYSYRYSGPWQDQITVDIVSLKKDYPDVRGWLFFENEDISYPIMQSSKDDTYMKTAYTGEKTQAGSIFMEALNKPDFSDSHIIIYGHNMRNRTMFGRLKNYETQSGYYDYHKYFQIISQAPDGSVIKSRYKIFAYGKTDPNSLIYTVCRDSDAAFADIVQYIQSTSKVVKNVEVYQTDKVVTLSTCSTGNNRFTVSAVKCEECIQ